MLMNSPVDISLISGRGCGLEVVRPIVDARRDCRGTAVRFRDAVGLRRTAVRTPERAGPILPLTITACRTRYWSQGIGLLVGASDWLRGLLSWEQDVFVHETKAASSCCRRCGLGHRSCSYAIVDCWRRMDKVCFDKRQGQESCQNHRLDGGMSSPHSDDHNNRTR